MSTITRMKIQPQKADVLFEEFSDLRKQTQLRFTSALNEQCEGKYFIITLFICIVLYLYCGFLVIKHQLPHWPVWTSFHLLWITDDFKLVFLCNINTNYVLKHVFCRGQECVIK